MSEGRDLTVGMSETAYAIRRAIVRLHKKGTTYVEIAELLGVGEATVSRVLRLHRERGSVKRRPRGGGRRSPIRGKVAGLLVHVVKAMPDATVVELTDALMKRTELETSRSSVQRALQRLGYSRKKRPSAPWNGTSRSTLHVGDSSAPSFS